MSTSTLLTLFPSPNCFPDILPKPVLSASPPIRGQELKIQCKGWLAGLGFALYKEGEQEPVQQLGAVGREAFFTIRRMEEKDEGNYSCRTHTERHPFKWSEPSEPLELVIKGRAEKGVRGRRGGTALGQTLLSPEQTLLLVLRACVQS